MNGSTSGASRIFQALLADISEGRLKPGDSLASEQALMDRFGVSRTMVRDAVAMLAGIGAVDRARGRTGVIQQVDSSTISHFFPLILQLNGTSSLKEVCELRLLIESEGAAKACIRATDDQLKRIMECAEAYTSAAQHRKSKKSSQNDDHINLDTMFHMVIARAADNTMFVTLLEILTGFLRYVQYETCRDNVQRSRDASDEHRRIANAIASRDSDAARLEMSYHLRTSHALLHETLQAKAL